MFRLDRKEGDPMVNEKAVKEVLARAARGDADALDKVRRMAEKSNHPFRAEAQAVLDERTAEDE